MKQCEVVCVCVFISCHIPACGLRIMRNNKSLSLTSVALSAWSLMLMKACNCLSDPRLTGKSQGAFVVSDRSVVLPWLCCSFHVFFPEGWTPKRLSSSVSLSLDSLESSSGSLEDVVLCILKRKIEKEKTKLTYVWKQDLFYFSNFNFRVFTMSEVCLTAK